MEEETIVLTETEKKVETTVEEKKHEKRKYVNVFSAISFPEKTETKTLPKAVKHESLIVEKPNYDFIEPLTEKEKKIIHIEKDEPIQETKSRMNGSRLRTILFSLVVGVCGVWGIVNVVNLNFVSSSLQSVSNVYYNINLPNYLKNLTQLDAVNKSNMENLFETIPESPKPPTVIEEKSNFFDRLCNFIVGLFGG